MREIKFRGRGVFVFDATHSNWYYGYLLRKRDGRFIIRTRDDEHEFYVDPATVGQFTGLRDDDGKKIYEGDVLKFVTARIHTPFVVTFFAAAFRGHFLEKNGDYYTLEYLLRNEARVIGNIHDNPELLEVKSE